MRNYTLEVRFTFDTPAPALLSRGHKLKPEELRSYRWFGPNDLRTFGQRSRLKQMGLGPEDWQGKPVIGIINTWSEINPCHLHFKILAENVKKGVLQAGGMPVEIPVLSLC